MMTIRPYQAGDLNRIITLLKEEGWTTLAADPVRFDQAMEGSTALVAMLDGQICGYIRCITDKVITLFVAELLVDDKVRGQGIGGKLLQAAHDLYPLTRMELLATSTSKSYYEQKHFRPFYGFRKTYAE
ncbi:Acetyltransferase (GNAT) domain-containing protein [Terribacillus halophilus]|uniref:Acetyltransferase (GNAT) domain-containing protein n=1 Tax=Terribacillus halophilus TaxID=361279 RepID=A0A1G6TU50_9BACI|nr:GNAT family N-acetyltransferase [Terribacillus halophilus]SDD32692.1 Acetyltransferase (GNAT) domain-containing protein [Terribacillus halophilus]